MPALPVPVLVRFINVQLTVTSWVKKLDMKDTVMAVLAVGTLIFGLGVAWNSADSRIEENTQQCENFRAQADMRITDLEQDWARERSSILSDVKQLDQARHAADLERNTLKSDLHHIKDSLEKVISLLEDQVQLRGSTGR